MFLRRQRVFIGEYDGQAVYYDQKTREALAAPKSALLNTEKARKQNENIPLLVILIMGAGPGLYAFFSLFNVGVYSWKTLFYILLLWLSECIIVVGGNEIALYKNVRHAKPTTKKVFWEAAFGNLMVGRDKDFDPAKASAGIYRIFRVVMVLSCLYSFYLVYRYVQQFGQPIILDYNIWVMGLIWSVVIIMYSVNNPVRFMKIMRLYSEDKIMFTKEEG